MRATVRKSGYSWAYGRPSVVSVLCAALAAASVPCGGRVVRVAVENGESPASVREAFGAAGLGALHFPLNEASGGGTVSVRAGPQGKTLSTALPRMEIAID